MNYIRITKENIDKEHICCAMSGKQSSAKRRSAGNLSTTHTSAISSQTIPERTCTRQSYAGITKRVCRGIIGMSSPT